MTTFSSLRWHLRSRATGTLAVLALLVASPSGSAQLTEIRTVYVGSDDNEQIYGVTCPDGGVTQVVAIVPRGEQRASEAPQACRAAAGGQRTCVANAGIDDTAVLACEALRDGSR